MATIKEILAAEEAEATTKYKGYTIADLRKAFDAVVDPTDWKASWAAFVPHQLIGILAIAVQFYHADVIEIGGIQPITGKIAVSGKGYQAY